MVNEAGPELRGEPTRGAPAGATMVDDRFPGPGGTVVTAPSRDGIDGLDLRVLEASSLGPAERAGVHALFEATYRHADHDYLDRSLALLRNCAVAVDGGTVVGFGLGELRHLDLPGLPGQRAAMAGMCCVDAAFRRRGLFAHLEVLAIAGGRTGTLEGGRLLTCGRMAHPASLRVMRGNPSLVPQPGVVPSPWQQEVGAAIAGEYGVAGFDPATFVCRGRGRPIGEPILDLDVESSEWDVFAPVDRSRGDSLLGLSWLPDAPPGW